jgi:hypothetical protein
MAIYDNIKYYHLHSSVSKKTAARIFRGRITAIATNPGEKEIRQTWFRVMNIVKFLTYSIFQVFPDKQIQH